MGDLGDPAGTGGRLPSNIIELVAAACGSGGRPAILFEDGVAVGRSGLAERVERFAGYLRTKLDPGDRVAIMMENRAEFMIAWLAVVANRAALVAVNPSAQEHDAGHVLRDSEPALVIADRDSVPLVRRLASSGTSIRGVVEVEGPEPDGLMSHRGPADLPLGEVRVAPEDVTNVYYTSGSTGPPKGCMVDHRYWLRFVDLYMRVFGMGGEDRILTCLQFSYNDPSWHLLTSLRAETTFVSMRRFSVSRFWNVVRSCSITQLFGIGSIPSLLLTADRSPRDRQHAVRFAVQVGIPSPEVHGELVERWGFPWFELYGLTETGIVAAMPPDIGCRMIGSGSIGLPVTGAAIRIVDDQGRDVPRTVTGELLVRAPGMMRGYLNRPTDPNEAVGERWFRTGDLVRQDPDGFLYFVGRTKDVIRRGGENVAAAEVEAVLREHPAVIEATVVPVPDDLRGEEVKAHIRLAEEDSAPPEDLIAHCSARLAKHKVPRFIEYHEGAFPRTPSMRVAKRKLIEDDPDPRAHAWDREAAARRSL